METLRIALIDDILLRRGIVTAALEAAEVQVQPFASVDECLEADALNADVLLYIPSFAQTLAILQVVNSLTERYEIPLAVIASADPHRESNAIRELLHHGAKAYISITNTDLPAAIAALRYVRDGGIYAPLNNLLKPAKRKQKDVTLLTPRQQQVLDQLRQGFQNKLIAYHLKMSESTVKVHVREIMKKMGATNRTEAVFKSGLVQIQIAA